MIIQLCSSSISIALLLLLPSSTINAQSESTSATQAAFSEKVYGLEAGQSYYVKVTIGQPVWTSETSSVDNTYNLLFDTGSANDAVAGPFENRAEEMPVFDCDASSSCIEYSTIATVKYGSGAIQGPIVTDTFSGELLKQHNDNPFIMIEEEETFFQDGFQGILGTAYNSIAQPNGNAPETFYDTVVKNENLLDVFGLQLCGIRQPLLEGLPVDASSPINSGQWIVGGRDTEDGTRLFSGLIFNTPLIQEKWYVVAVSDIGVGTESLGLPCKAYNTPQALVDSGTSNISLPPDVYAALVASLTVEANRVGLPTEYLSDSVLCCDTDLCGPSNPNALVLTMEPITISFAFDDGGSGTQFSVSIPPQYYFRPVLASTSRTSCRAFGISESTYTVLGDVFMDGLYTFHDRVNQQVGIAVADNCPNGVTSAKTISEITETATSSWCECLSDTEQSDTLVAGLLPGTKRCFFWQWWMTFILLSIVITVSVGGYVLYTILVRRNQRAAAKSKKQKAPPRLVTTPGGNTYVVGDNSASTRPRDSMNDTISDAILGYDPSMHSPIPTAVHDSSILGNSEFPNLRHAHSTPIGNSAHYVAFLPATASPVSVQHTAPQAQRKVAPVPRQSSQPPRPQQQVPITTRPPVAPVPRPAAHIPRQQSLPVAQQVPASWSVNPVPRPTAQISRQQSVTAPRQGPVPRPAVQTLRQQSVTPPRQVPVPRPAPRPVAQTSRQQSAPVPQQVPVQPRPQQVANKPRAIQGNPKPPAVATPPPPQARSQVVKPPSNVGGKSWQGNAPPQLQTQRSLQANPFIDPRTIKDVKRSASVSGGAAGKMTAAKGAPNVSAWKKAAAANSNGAKPSLPAASSSAVMISSKPVVKQPVKKEMSKIVAPTKPATSTTENKHSPAKAPIASTKAAKTTEQKPKAVPKAKKPAVKKQRKARSRSTNWEVNPPASSIASRWSSAEQGGSTNSRSARPRTGSVSLSPPKQNPTRAATNTTTAQRASSSLTRSQSYNGLADAAAAFKNHPLTRSVSSKK